MKARYAVLTGLAMVTLTTALAQVESDDMYFNSKDRAQVNATKQVVLAKQYKQEDLLAAKVSPINPTDSYSGRSVNPEYTNRLKTNPNLTNTDNQYFVSGYQPLNVNQNLSSNTCNCGINNFNSPYGYGGYGMNMYGMNPGFGSPYSSFYSPWGMGSGFYQPGWSSMLGYGFGGMNSGWFGSMNYGFGNSWGNPWNYRYGGSSFYNSYGYGGYGSNYYGNSGGDYHNPVVYSKRANRSSDIDNVFDHSRPETGYTRNGRIVSNGRSRTEDQSQYYDRAWKRDPDKNPSRSSWNDYSSSNNSGSRSGWNDYSTTGRQYSSDSGNSRSSYNSGNSGSTSTGSSGRSSAGTHSRGRD